VRIGVTWEAGRKVVRLRVNLWTELVVHRISLDCGLVFDSFFFFNSLIACSPNAIAISCLPSPVK
jgi:hypothetical protein